MPTALVSSVNHPNGIYLTAGQGTRIELLPHFESLTLTLPNSSLSYLSFHLNLHQLLPSPSCPASSKVLSAPSDQLQRRQRHRLVQDVCSKCYTRGLELTAGLNNHH